MGFYTNIPDLEPSEAVTAAVHIGLDVHKDTVVVAVARRCEYSRRLEVLDRGSIANRALPIKRLATALADEFKEELHFVYEAGPCGFVIWRQLRELGISCAVAAPSLIPKKSGDRVKTDRRDARELARLSLLGYLTPIWVPGEAQEALRDMVRWRMDLKRSIQKQRQQISHFLLRHGHPYKATKWNEKHFAWMRNCKFAQPAQQITLASSLDSLETQQRHLEELDQDLIAQAKQGEWKPLIDSLRALRGVDYLAAITIIAEIGDLRRFRSAPQFMAYVGLVPSEFSSGGRRRTGSITKTGNGAVRRILVESAWTYRFAPRQTHHLQRKAKNASDYARERAWKAQKRLCGRYLALCRKGKNHKTIVTAIARELAAFIWDIGCRELNQMQPTDTQ